MATIHCPSCHRALAIPHHQLGAVAACPLCKHEFQTPDTEPPAPRPRDDPPPPLQSEPTPRESRPLALPDHVAPDDWRETPGTRGLESSAGWLKAAAYFSVLEIFCCTCFDAEYISYLLGVPFDSLDALLGIMFLRFVPTGILVGCAHTMGSGGLRAWIAAFTGLGLGILHFTLSAVQLIDVLMTKGGYPGARIDSWDRMAGVVSLGLGGLILFTAFVGCLKTIRALSQRERTRQR